ncbi:chromosome partitioning protein parB [Legionella quinlivanii]|uniref:Chromosome partitioning protein parB n=1 Tax=Legionella quinlivanii TaxID=45073 RepID=A0A0W0XS18_9GAMM|nr:MULTISPECIES: ParB/RepB/Spo0J family partition protein [Legionella]KTD47432.1 chromosome partitioning protein parB [Legionella quinlivanii]MCE3043674.1 ParB/RepB/Spo0J family partition protein [Legionella sp. 16cNR16C]SEG46223.1 chromosome partitioning protein, ParB family [Legionella quinlivanii DSM 21216]STY49847.1 chromosome partitioning protein parB [Legionella quinlivanii]
MKVDIRKQAVTGAIIKDNASDWKNIATKEIEENKSLKEQIESLEEELANKENYNILEIDPKKCRNWKYADRNRFELGSIDELAEDIKQNGQLQPAIVRKIDSLDFEYEVIAGERRWRACTIANLNLKVVITKEDDAGCLVIQTSENKKKSLSAYSLAVAYEKLMIDLNISQNELSRRLNIPKTSFSELMSFNKVPKEVWESVEDMTKVKPKTAAFLSLMCSKGDEYLAAVMNCAQKIREGYGTDNLKKFIEKHLSNIKTNRNSSRVYEGKTGEVLFRITSEGRISLSKPIIKKIDIDNFTEYLGKYLEDKL